MDGKSFTYFSLYQTADRVTGREPVFLFLNVATFSPSFSPLRSTAFSNIKCNGNFFQNQITSDYVGHVYVGHISPHGAVETKLRLRDFINTAIT